MKTFSNGSNPCEHKNPHCQKCEVLQRPSAANAAEHQSTPHLCQLNIRKRPCRWCTPTETDRNEAGKRCFYRDCSQERPRAGLGSFPRSGDAHDEQTGQRVSGSRAVLQFECSALARVREPNHFRASVENGGSRKETVPFRNAFDWLRCENTRSKTANFIIRNCYRSRDS
jgi:hypothetical protein